MQIKRLLDDREVLAGDKVFDAQGRSYEFVEQANGQLTATLAYVLCLLKIKPVDNRE